jgi:small-conductance mechanosensitive channel
MNTLNEIHLGNTIQAWLIALGITLGCVVLLSLLKKIIAGRLTAFAAKTATGLDDLVAQLLQKIRFFFLFTISLYAGSFVLSLAPQADRILRSLVIVAFLLQSAIWGNSIITFWLTRTLKHRVQEDASGATTLSVLGFVGRVVLWTTILLLALDNLGVNITALVAGLGVGGVAVALALQSVLGDLFASLSIVLDKPFVIGDCIVVGNYMGTIEHIGLKTTRVRSLSGEQIVFSNSDLLSSRIRNYKRMFERRVVFIIQVTYQTPYDKVASIPDVMRRIIEAQPQTRFDRAHFKEYADSSLIFEAVYYVKTPDYNSYMDIQQAINLELFQKFQELKIEFAYPTRTVFINRETGGAGLGELMKEKQVRGGEEQPPRTI